MATRRRLNKSEVFRLVAENLYRPDPTLLHAVRCIDSDYEPDSQLAPISYPGGDFGILGLIYASGQAYGFEIDHSRVFEILLGISGGVEQFSCCQASDENGDTDISTYLPFASNVDFDDEIITILKQQYETVRSSSTMVHSSYHQGSEGAIVTVKGPYAVAPFVQLADENGRLVPMRVYCLQKTFLSDHIRTIADRFTEEGVVTLYPGCDQEYLYEVLSEMVDTCFYSSLQTEFKIIPIFTVEITDDASITVTEVSS